MKKIVALIVGLCSLSAIASNGQAESYTLTIKTGEYKIVNNGDKQRVEIEGYGTGQRSGEPMLPETFLNILLPPGVKVVSLNAEPLGYATLPGTYNIEPTPTVGNNSHPGLEYNKEVWEKNYQYIYLMKTDFPDKAWSFEGTMT